MRTCTLVMNGMVAVVEEHDVEHRSDKIARVIPLRFLVSMNMLDVIEEQNAEQRELLWQDNKEQRFLPADHKCRRPPEHEQHILRKREIEPRTVCLMLHDEIVADRLLLKITADRRISQKHQEVVVLRESVSDRVIAFLIIKTMMVHVVRRNPGERRKSVEHCEPIIREGVQRLVAPDRYMVVVMRDDRDGNRHEQVS